MSKNSQYGRWRRAAMQAVLWLVFGGTLALAAYFGHRRTASQDALGEPMTFGALSLRLPAGWERQQRPGANPLALAARERDEEGRDRRQLWVTQEAQADRQRGPALYLETTLSLPDTESKPEPFDFLGGRGVLFVWRGVPRELRVPPNLVERLPDPGLYACTVLRDGLTVTVQVRGEGAFGPSSRRLLRRVADSMKLATSTTLPTINSPGEK